MTERRKSFPKRGRDQGCTISEKKNIGKNKRRWGRKTVQRRGN